MSSSDALWLRIWGVFAAIGFIIVIIGVVIEGVEHFKQFQKKEHARKLQIEKLGWFLVVVGLGMEFLGDNAAKRISDRESARLNKEAGDARKDAGAAVERAGIANERAALLESDNLVLRSNVAALELHVMETSNKVDKIDPRNAIISYLTASVYFEVNGTNPPLKMWGDPNYASTLVVGKGKSTYSMPSQMTGFPLYASGFSFGFTSSRNTNDFYMNTKRSYALTFQTEGSAAFVLANGPDIPVKDLLDANFLWISLKFVPKQTEILRGTAEIVANGNIHKMFNIFPQIDTNLLDGTTNFPYIVIATNLIETPESIAEREAFPITYMQATNKPVQ
jgi:hypothetical protein